MPEQRFEISYSPSLRWLFVALGMGPRRSAVVVGDGMITVAMGWSFRARIPLDAVQSVRPDKQRVSGWGVHGWRGYWLVTGSSFGLVCLDIVPAAPARAVLVPVRLRLLQLSLADPEGFIAAASRPKAAGTVW